MTGRFGGFRPPGVDPEPQRWPHISYRSGFTAVIGMGVNDHSLTVTEPHNSSEFTAVVEILKKNAMAMMILLTDAKNAGSRCRGV